MPFAQHIPSPFDAFGPLHACAKVESHATEVAPIEKPLPSFGCMVEVNLLDPPPPQRHHEQARCSSATEPILNGHSLLEHPPRLVRCERFRFGSDTGGYGRRSFELVFELYEGRQRNCHGPQSRK